jgi:predicted lipid-binding transport protein (Tim44 family)
MRKNLSSTSSAKDKSILSNLDDLEIALKYVDPEFMTVGEYEALQARDTHVPLRKPKQPPLHLSRFGVFMVGLIAGALVALLTAFVAITSGAVAGLLLVLGTVMILATIGLSLGASE